MSIINKSRRIYLGVVSISFIIWSGLFIYRASFIAIDGKRYFCLLEDAMISMRYAWNLSHGLGLVWNPGIRVEGITNMLMTLYMALVTFLFDKITAVLVIQFSGIGFMLAIAYFTMKIAGTIFTPERTANREFLLGLSFTIALCYFPLVYWTLMGMETGLLTVLLLGAIWIAIGIGRKPGIKLLLPNLLGLAFLARPDALIFIAIIIAYRAIGVIKHKKGLVTVLAEAGIIGLYVAGLTVFRLGYYGDMVPNTYTLKISGIPLWFRIKNGWGFVVPFLHSMALPIVIALLCLVFNFNTIILLLMSLFFASLAYQIWTGGDVWSYWRTMSPFIPLLFIVCIQAVSNIVRSFFKSKKRFKTGISPSGGSRVKSLVQKMTIAGIVFLLLIVPDYRFIPQIFLISPARGSAKNHKNINQAIAIRQLTLPGASVAVLEAGVIPYFTGRRAIDMLGKSDRYIASLPPDLSGAVSWGGMKSVPGHNKYDLRYSLITLRPTYVYAFSWGRDDLSAFGRENYRRVQYQGVGIWLLKGSEEVLWQKIWNLKSRKHSILKNPR